MHTGVKNTIDRMLDGLNEPQRAAVTHTEGPLLILAGPGSGKTRVVTHRAAHLALTTVEPWRILAITFTNKATREMRERVDALGVASGMTVSTFHAFCARTLRIFANRAGLQRNFTILDRDDRRKMLKKAITDAGLSGHWTPAGAERIISDAKNEMISAEAYDRNASEWRELQFVKIYKQYEVLLQQTASLDFDDLLMKVALLLEKDTALRNELEDQYAYVLIDEYQDTNAPQYKIAELLTRDHGNLCATGDPDQSIYGWRGANIENILRFEDDHPAATVVRLEQNYRSTQHILTAADALIAGNINRKEKTLWTENDDGSRVRIVEHELADDEANALAREIRAQITGGFDASDIAILYRINSLSRVIEEALLREGVRYQIARGVEFYNRKEIKDVLAYLRVLVNPVDEIALLRIINTPARGIGSTTIQRLVDAARQANVSILELLQGNSDLTPLGRSAGKVKIFAELLTSLQAALELPPPEALAYVINHSGLRAMYAHEGEIDNEPIGNLDELVSAASAFAQERPDASLVDWLEHAALVSDVDCVVAEGGLVTLMTLHAAKGLEFETVYIIGLEDGLLPFRRADDVEADDEEERRLCFVGMTRAKRRLTLSRARYRMLRGITERTVRSPFLDELPDSAVECAARTPKRTPRKSKTPDGRLPDDIAEWTLGTLVEHPTDGLGQVMSMTRGGKRTFVEVLFKTGSRKTFALEFADLRRVDFDEVG